MIVNSATLKIRGGIETDSNGKKAGKGALIQWDKSATLGVTQDQTLFVWSTESADTTPTPCGQPIRIADSTKQTHQGH